MQKMKGEMIMNIRVLTRILLVAGIYIPSTMAQRTPQIGAYFFNDWLLYPERGKHDFPEHEPVWGYTEGTLENMERQIGLAADAGLAFWSFCWYAPENPPQNWRGRAGLTYANHPLNDALRLYLKAQNRDRLKFNLLVANHYPYSIIPEQWDELTDHWVGLMKQESYLKPDGNPLIVFYSGQGMLEKFGGAEALRKAFDLFRQKAADAGLSGVRIGVCSHEPSQELEDAGFDVYTGYHFRWMMSGVKWGQCSPFSDMAAAHRKSWAGYPRSQTDLPVIPLLAAGWDDRPRRREDKNDPFFWWVTDPTPKELYDHLLEMMHWMDAHPEQCFRDQVAVIYAWNEVGEGGYLTPSRGRDNRFMGAVRAALDGRCKLERDDAGRVCVDLPEGLSLRLPGQWLRIFGDPTGPLAEACSWDLDFSVVFVPEEGGRTLFRAVAPRKDGYAAADVRIIAGSPHPVEGIKDELKERLAAENLKLIEMNLLQDFVFHARPGRFFEYRKTGSTGEVRCRMIHLELESGVLQIRLMRPATGVLPGAAAVDDAVQFLERQMGLKYQEQ